MLPVLEESSSSSFCTPRFYHAAYWLLATDYSPHHLSTCTNFFRGIFFVVGLRGASAG